MILVLILRMGCCKLVVTAAGRGGSVTGGTGSGGSGGGVGLGLGLGRGLGPGVVGCDADLETGTMPYLRTRMPQKSFIQQAAQARSWSEYPTSWQYHCFARSTYSLGLSTRRPEASNASPRTCAAT